MAFSYVEVWIEGTMPLLMSRFTEEAEASVPGGHGKGTRSASSAAVKPTPREQAEKSAYREGKKPGAPLVFPGAALQRLMREAGSNHKEKGTRKTLKYRVPAAVLVLDEFVPLYADDRKKRAEDFEVDSRSAVNPFTKGRMMCHRPRLEKWAAKFRIRINEEVMNPQIIRQLLTEGGEQIGIGAFRPEKGGTFGLFSVVAWDCVDGRSATKKAA